MPLYFEITPRPPMNATRSVGPYSDVAGMLLPWRRSNCGRACQTDPSRIPIPHRGEQCGVVCLPDVWCLTNETPIPRVPSRSANSGLSASIRIALRKLRHISGRIEQPGLAVMHEFPPRTQVCCHDRASLRVGLENRLAQRFVGVRRKNGEARTPDQPVALIRDYLPRRTPRSTNSVRAANRSSSRLLRAIAGNHQIRSRESLHGAQQIVNALLPGKPATVKKWSIAGSALAQ